MGWMSPMSWPLPPKLLALILFCAEKSLPLGLIHNDTYMEEADAH